MPAQLFVRRALICCGSIAALGALVVPSAAAGAERTLPPASPPGAVAYNKVDSGRWAYSEYRAAVRTRPSDRAMRVTNLRLDTEDGFPEVYPVLMRWTDPQDRTWFKVRIPGRPNGRVGWVARRGLQRLSTASMRLVVDRSALRATLYRSGKQIFSARIGVGKSGTPTPSGSYWVREKFKVKGAPIYGPYAIGTSAYAPYLTDWPGGGVIGLHGTNQPALVPGRPSHGCIRMRNADISRLFRLVTPGTPIKIV